MKREVSPELLDGLDSKHPDAVASRRDLRVINAVMGNFRWLRKKLRASMTAGMRVAELGAGDGALAVSVAPTKAQWAALDLAPQPTNWPPSMTWLQVDFFSEQGRAALEKAEVVVGNLVLHHFQADQLLLLGDLFRNARILLFVEPCRRAWHIAQGIFLTKCLFMNRVTRHDLVVSVRAGFRKEELAAALGLGPDDWEWSVVETPLGAYRFEAVRK